MVFDLSPPDADDQKRFPPKCIGWLIALYVKAIYYAARSCAVRMLRVSRASNGHVYRLAVIGFEREPTVTCAACGSEKQSKFTAEIAIHFPGLTGLNKPHVWVFPELCVCLNCGKSEFAISEDKLRLLGKGEAAADG